MSLVHRLILVVCDMDVVPHLSTLTIGRLPVEPASREGHSGFLLSGWLLLEPHTSAVGRFHIVYTLAQSGSLAPVAVLFAGEAVVTRVKGLLGWFS